MSEVEKKEIEKLLKEIEEVKKFYVMRYSVSGHILKWLSIVLMIYFGLQIAISIFQIFFKN